MERGSYRIWDMTQDRKTENFFKGRKEDASPKMRAVVFDRKFKG